MVPTTKGLECEVCKARETCFFADLKDGDFQDFRLSRISNTYRKRQVVFYEDHNPHGVYVVCSGRIKVYKSDRKGHQLTVRVASQGEILGYRALLASEPYSATAEALEDSTLAFIDETKFKALLTKHQALTLRMLTQLAREVRGAEDKARDMAMKSSKERLAELLILLKATYGKLEKKGNPLKIPFTRQELADMAGLAQETVIRLLTDLEERKVIAMNGRQLTVVNERTLEKEAGTLT